MRNFTEKTKARYLEIYTLRLNGMTYQGIADKYGFTRARAFAICKIARQFLLPPEQASVQQ